MDGRVKPGHDGVGDCSYGPAMRKGYVYILANKPYGTLYLGVTSDLSARLQQHRRGIASSFTKRYRVTRLVYCEVHNWLTSAIQRESSIKRGSGTGKLN
jgi:putative endonuclease